MPSETTWKIEQHTKAKHEILRGYLSAWAPIVSQNSIGDRVLFVDGFAGPGMFEEGPGSPIIAVETLIGHKFTFRRPIHCMFIESNANRFSSLEAHLAKYTDANNKPRNVVVDHPIPGECHAVLSAKLAEIELAKRPLGPALFFLDQFGYSQVPMSLIARIMKHQACEVLTYLEFQKLNWFLGEEIKDGGRNEAFGSDGWKGCRNYEGEKRASCILRQYKAALKNFGNTKYVWDFAMVDSQGRLLYWLFFCTNNLRGLEEMKKAMSKVGSGHFRYSDRLDKGQLQLLNSFNNQWLSECIWKQFSGQTVTVGVVWEYVLTETPRHTFGNEMQGLLKARKILSMDGNVRISFNENHSTIIQFVPYEGLW